MRKRKRKYRNHRKHRSFGKKWWRKRLLIQITAIFLGIVFVPIVSVFSLSGMMAPIEVKAAIGLGIETVYEDEIWMGWTIFESGNVGYGQAGGDGGRAYGRYQFDYAFALPGFLSYVVSKEPVKYAMLSKYIHYRAGSEELLSSAGLGTDWVRAYNADREEFSRLQDEYAYDQYYLPAKRAMASHGIDLDEIDDPSVKGTVYSFSIRNGAYDSGVRSAWQSYSPGDDIRTWLNRCIS